MSISIRIFASLTNAVLCLLAAASSVAQDAPTRLVRTTEALTPEQEQAKLHVPEGFTVQLFASEPMINKPINMGFDARGRLWVSSTVEYPYAAAKGRWADPQGSRVKDSRDAIKILKDTDGDGRADKASDFADGLNIPTGVLPWHKPEHKAGCIAWSIPNIWYLADTDGDGKCDKREVLFGPLGYERDTHGMCSSFRLGADGWVYATHGFNNTSHFKARDGSTLDLHSGNVFRFRPDGSRIEAWSWGQVNPFGLVFDARGNLYSADCHSAPIYQLLRGAFYPSFGKPDDGLGFGPAMLSHTHGSTGICGLAFIEGGVWGEKWDGHMFVGNPVTSRVNHDLVEWRGATPVAKEQPDFITSDDPWFRPVDLRLGPDGALYVADFYNRIIGHYEVPLDHPGRDRERGRIWRIVPPHGSGASKRDDFARIRALRALAESGMNDAARATAIAALKDSDAHVRLAAAAALQRHPAAEALPVLLDLLASTPGEDTHLRHTVRMALREHLKRPGTFAAAAEWMSKAAPELRADFNTIARAVPTAEAAAFAFNVARAEGGDLLKSLPHAGRYGDASLVAEAVRFARERFSADTFAQVEAVQALHNGLAERGERRSEPLLAWAQELAQTLLAQAGAATVPDWAASPGESPWVLQKRRCADGHEATVLSSLDLGARGAEQRTGVLRSKDFVPPPKLAFWLCGHRGAPNAAAHEKNLVRLVDAANGEVLRHAFPPRNDVCQHIDWDLSAHADRRVRIEIVDGDDGRAYAWLGITRIEPPVVSVERFSPEERARKALRTLAGMLRFTAPVGLRDRLAAYLPASNAPQPAPVAPGERAKLDALIRTRATEFATAKADAARGAAVYAQQCALCHRINGNGGLVGPQLDGIGTRGAERLCEDILDPNRNVDSHFFLHTFKLRDGSTLAGFVRGEAGAVLLIADAAGQEQRIAKADVTEDVATPHSLMPSAFAQTIPARDFHDLLAYLLESSAK